MGKRLWLLVGLVIIASTIMVTGATAKSDGVSSSAQRTTLVFGAEQDINGFNTNLECCNQFWAVVIGNTPVLRGVSMINARLQYVPDLARKIEVRNRPFRLTYHLRKNARWSDGRQVTGNDIVFSWQKIMDPASQVAGRDGYDQISRARVFNKGKSVTFSFK